MKTIGQIICEKRLERDLSQCALAKKLGVSRELVHHWERGHCCPNIYNCWDLADFFECTIDELCGRTEVQNDLP